MKPKYDAIVVGSGPNGFAAGITLQRAGLDVLLIESRETLGGGMRSAELTLPGFIHDICSSVYPLGENSPVFKNLQLEQFGLEYVASRYAVAHPFDDGSSVSVQLSIDSTAEQFGDDCNNYKKIFLPFTEKWPEIRSAFLSPLHWSTISTTKARFACYAIQSAVHFAKHHFKTLSAQAFFAGMAAHSMLPLNKISTSSIALVLNTVAHINGWPIAKGGSQQFTNALEKSFLASGGNIQTGWHICSLKELPPSKIVLLDVTAAQLLSIAKDQFSVLYKWQLRRYQYGAGVFKIDWALSEPVPFINQQCKFATTVHIGGGFQDIYTSERDISKGQHAESPFVLFVQPTIADSSRAPEGKHTAWAYCHVPNGSQKDMTSIIEKQVERFVPGFKDCILARHCMNTVEMQNYNSNYIGGDINGGAATISQLYTRPVIRLTPYRTGAKNVYLCSSSTPPGGGVHGFCGYYAARQALSDTYDIHLPWL